MSDLIPVNNAAIPQAASPAPPQTDYLAEAREQYAGLPQQDLRPPDYDALAAQNAAIEQTPIGPDEAGAPTGPLTYSAFQASVLGDAPVVDLGAYDNLLSRNAQLDKETQSAASQNASNLVAAGANEARAVDTAANAEAAKAEAQAPAKAQLAVEAEKYETQVRRLNEQARFEVDNQIRAVRVAADAAQAFQFKDFWASRNTAGTIMGIIAQALGGGLNALSNQPGAPTMLDRVIAQDFALQQAKAQQLQANVATQKGLLSEIRASVKDRNDQAQAFYLASTQKIQAQLDAIAAKSTSPIVKANAEAAKAKIAASVAEKMQKYDESNFNVRRANLGQAANITNMRQNLIQRMAEVHLGKKDKVQEQMEAMRGTSVGGVDTSNLGRLPARQQQNIQNRISLIDRAMHDIENYEKNPSMDPTVNTAKIAAIKNSLPAALGLSGSGLSEYVQKLEATRIPGAYQVMAGKVYPGNATKFANLKEELRRAMSDIISGNNLRALPGSYWDSPESTEASAPPAKPLSAAEMKQIAAKSRAK